MRRPQWKGGSHWNDQSGDFGALNQIAQQGNGASLQGTIVVLALLVVLLYARQSTDGSVTYINNEYGMTAWENEEYAGFPGSASGSMPPFDDESPPHSPMNPFGYGSPGPNDANEYESTESLPGSPLSAGYGQADDHMYDEDDMHYQQQSPANDSPRLQEHCLMPQVMTDSDCVGGEAPIIAPRAVYNE
jgi:hypothetical protein